MVPLLDMSDRVVPLLDMSLYFRREPSAIRTILDTNSQFSVMLIVGIILCAVALVVGIVSITLYRMRSWR